MARLDPELAVDVAVTAESTGIVLVCGEDKVTGPDEMFCRGECGL